MKTTLFLGLFLAFKLTAAEPLKPAQFDVRLIVDSPSADTEQLIWTHPGKAPQRLMDEILLVQKKSLLDRSALGSASVRKDPVTGAAEILITLTEAGTKGFAEVTRDRIGQRLAFLIDGKIYSAPKIMTEIRGGKAAITGFTPEQATQLASRLNSQPNIHVQANAAAGDAATKSLSLEQLKAKAESGDAKAQHVLGIRYFKGDGQGKDFAAAAKWFRKAAEQGFASAQCELATLCANGVGVEQSDVEAVKWYRKAAEQEEPSAQVSLGSKYENGQGVEKNDAEAIKWYLRAAEQGDSQGQVALANMYQKGQGITKDYVEAVKWYRKAADQGSVVGQAYLGSLYVTGQGVEKNLGEAYAFLSLAVMNGFEGVGNLRDAVGKRLSQEQLSEAQKRIDRLKMEIRARQADYETKP